MRAPLLGGERRTHFKKESDPRRRKIVAAIADMEVSVRLYGRSTTTMGVSESASGRSEAKRTPERSGRSLSQKTS